ncbi:rab15 effector protein [Bombina bombina]|uniref:rab15 effector protein n=1 Tax=Bombina bombina TaxID=8345 RepID=UPI00235ADD69|nr:rab15 effector protein [Bombina bombina]
MGQNSSVQEIVIQQDKADIICEIFSNGVVHASQKLKEYLGFEDPLGSLCPSTDTLNDIFLVNFITFCIEKGVEERITTAKLSKQQSLLFGVDWIWTLHGPDKLVKLQIAVQALQMAESNINETNNQSLLNICNTKEIQLADIYKDKSRFEKLEEFCRLIGADCMGLFMVYGLPGRPKDIRGVLLDSVNKENAKSLMLREHALQNFILNTDTFIPAREMLEKCMTRKNGQKNIGKVYINFL